MAQNEVDVRGGKVYLQTSRKAFSFSEIKIHGTITQKRSVRLLETLEKD